MDSKVKGISGRFELEREKALAGDMRRRKVKWELWEVYNGIKSNSYEWALYLIIPTTLSAHNEISKTQRIV